LSDRAFSNPRPAGEAAGTSGALGSREVVEYLEEDFRFATKRQVAAYSIKELTYRPHINGFDLSQMFDQLDGHLIASRASGRRSQALVQAPGGTALCTARHMTPHENDFAHELVIHVTDHYDSNTIAQLQGMPHVTEVFYDLATPKALSPYYRDCVLMLDQHEGWPCELAMDGPELLLIYDPDDQRESNHPGFEYFMNSNMRVRCGN